MGHFPGEKYHIKPIDNPTPLIHPSCIVPLHILPVYKGEFVLMIIDDVFAEVLEPTGLVNSICVTSKKPLMARRK